MPQTLIDNGFITYFPVLIGNIVAIITCLVVGPRSWSRRLCTTSLWFTGLFLLFVLADLTLLTVATGLRQEAEFAFAIIVMGCIPIAIEFLALLAIARWLGFLLSASLQFRCHFAFPRLLSVMHKLTSSQQR